MGYVLLVVLGLAGAAGVYVFRRSRRIDHLQEAMRQRLAGLYDEATPPNETVPLRSPGPHGHIAVSPEGLLVALGPKETDYRQVLWSDVSIVSPASDGRCVVHISRVGDITVSGSLGRQIWESVSGARRGAS